MGAASGKYKAASGDSESSTLKVNITHTKTATFNSELDEDQSIANKLLMDTDAASTVSMDAAPRLTPGMLGREEVADKRHEADHVTSRSGEGANKESKKKGRFGMILDRVASKIGLKSSQEKGVADEISDVKPTNTDPTSSDSGSVSGEEQHKPIESNKLPEYDLATGLMTNMPTFKKKKNFRRTSISTGVLKTVDDGSDGNLARAIRRSESDRIPMRSATNETEHRQASPASSSVAESQHEIDSTHTEADQQEAVHQEHEEEHTSEVPPQSFYDEQLSDIEDAMSKNSADEMGELDVEHLQPDTPLTTSQTQFAEPLKKTSVIDSDDSEDNVSNVSDETITDGAAFGLVPDDALGDLLTTAAPTVIEVSEFTPADGDGPTRLHTKIPEAARYKRDTVKNDSMRFSPHGMPSVD